MYYLTVVKNDEEMIRRKQFADFAAALAELRDYYRPKAGRSTLVFTTEVINGEFARSFAVLADPQSVHPSEPFYRERMETAVRTQNAFEYDGNLTFLIESEHGINDCEVD